MWFCGLTDGQKIIFVIFSVYASVVLSLTFYVMWRVKGTQEDYYD